MKKVVYTALTGSYDALEQHKYVNPEYDYICFSNDFGDKKKIGIWTIRKINYPSDDKQLQSRFPKLQPHEVLPEYDISLYVDANVNILTPYLFRRIDELMKESVKLAGVKHQFRDCLYEEGYRVWIGGVDKNINVIRKQLSYYKQDGFPRHFGMYEANVIFRQHNDPLIIKQCDEWWRLRLNYSKRDQLGYSYTLWKYNIPFAYLLPEDQWARNSKEVTCRVRPQKYPYLKQKVVNAYYKFYIPLKQKIGFPIFYKAL
ncbi:DUF616 domain-containing protein [Segatella copri]|uniref:glycosyltransferase domain-containing protein n=1 Tax=Segatella copri TaxID=165179 RepID=UPI00294B4191|nr:glycosyltransferase domain-containing protein [Segatella copri]WOF96301.1 DUF616 domain-containing protein [Segatella copri]